MKKLSMLLTLAFIAAGALFHSCQKEENQAPELKLENVLKVAPVSNYDYDEADCEVDCIEIGGPYFEMTDFKTETMGQNTKKVTYWAYNTESDFVVKVLYEIAGPSNSEADITVVVNGVSKKEEAVEKGTTVTFEFTLDAGWEACDIVEFSIEQEELGPAITWDEEYSLIGVCQGCEDDLDTDLQCGDNDDPNVLTVTFQAGESGNYVVQGGLNAKVDGIIGEYEATSGGFNQGHSGVVNSNANVIRWEGYLDACDLVTITVEFTGKCEIGEWTGKLQE